MKPQDSKAEAELEPQQKLVPSGKVFLIHCSQSVLGRPEPWQITEADCRICKKLLDVKAADWYRCAACTECVHIEHIQNKKSK